MAELFWLVWCPTGNRPPAFRHSSEGSAVAEAGRLAEENPDEQFFVLSAIGFASADKPRAHFMSLVEGSLDLSEVTERDGYLPLQPTAPARVLKHGEYQPGDRVRYVGRVKHSLQTWNGRRGTVISVSPLTIYVHFDGQHTHSQTSLALGNVEHETVPHFEVGDIVRHGREGGFHARVEMVTPTLVSAIHLDGLGGSKDAASSFTLIRPVQAAT